jgi:TonB family protein
VIEIDDFSARYHGNKATLHGRIALSGAGGADQDDVKALAKRIVARFEIKVPLAIVRDVAASVAARQAAAQQGNGAAGQMSGTQLGQSITDVIVGKLVGGGFARVENDALVSTVEWRDGELRANGKRVALPAATPPTTATQTVAAGASMDLPAVPLPPDALRARRVETSCRMPDYPDEVVSQNRPLRLVLSYRIAVDGKVLDPAIASPSRFPAWDQAALAALAQCSYVPALKNGTAIELPMVWTIQREPGTARP